MGKTLILPFIIDANPTSYVDNCQESVLFQNRLLESTKKIDGRLSNYSEGSIPYLDLELQINKAKARFDKYGAQGLLCGSGDGLPHLTGFFHPTYAGDLFPATLVFLYITIGIGFSGWKYQEYLIHWIDDTDQEDANIVDGETIIDVPIALEIMVSCLFWPLSLWGNLEGLLPYVSLLVLWPKFVLNYATKIWIDFFKYTWTWMQREEARVSFYMEGDDTRYSVSIEPYLTVSCFLLPLYGICFIGYYVSLCIKDKDPSLLTLAQIKSRLIGFWYGYWDWLQFLLLWFVSLEILLKGFLPFLKKR